MKKTTTKNLKAEQMIPSAVVNITENTHSIIKNKFLIQNTVETLTSVTISFLKCLLIKKKMKKKKNTKFGDFCFEKNIHVYTIFTSNHLNYFYHDKHCLVYFKSILKVGIR